MIYEKFNSLLMEAIFGTKACTSGKKWSLTRMRIKHKILTVTVVICLTGLAVIVIPFLLIHNTWDYTSVQLREAVLSRFDDSLTIPERITRHSATPCEAPAFFIAIVHSAIDKFQYRQSIRKSWGSSKLFSTPDRPHLWRTLFIIGRSRIPSLNTKVEEESRFYGDIILGEFIDSYQNLTYKTMLAMKWAHVYCRPRFILKVDDDVFVNPYLLYNELQIMKNTRNLYTGYAHINARPFRDKSNKWYVSYSDYEDEYFPDYCFGGGYILSGDMLGKVLSLERNVKKCNLEDVYTGMLVRKAKGRVTHDNRFESYYSFYRFWTMPQTCSYKAIILQHGVPKPEDHMRLTAIAKSGFHSKDCQCLPLTRLCYRSNSWLSFCLYIVVFCIIGVLSHHLLMKITAVRVVYKAMISFIADTMSRGLIVFKSLADTSEK